MTGRRTFGIYFPKKSKRVPAGDILQSEKRRQKKDYGYLCKNIYTLQTSHEVQIPLALCGLSGHTPRSTGHGGGLPPRFRRPATLQRRPGLPLQRGGALGGHDPPFLVQEPHAAGRRVRGGGRRRPDALAAVRHTALRWNADSRAITFEYNERGHKVYRVLELSAETGRVRTLVEETHDRYVNYPRIFRHNCPATPNKRCGTICIHTTARPHTACPKPM